MTQSKGGEIVQLAVVGLGKLGSVVAAACSSAGHQVVGTDVNETVAGSIKRGIAPFNEPGLQELISESGSRLTATTDARLAIDSADATLVVVPTPSQAHGEFSNRFVVNSLTTIGSNLQGLDSDHTVIVCSTVSPGSCTSELIPTLEEASGRRVGDSLGFVYSPQFIALGSIIANLRNPDMVLIGASDERAALVAKGIWESIAENSPSWQLMSLDSAEIVKLSVNAYVTMKISFANMLDELCEAVPGADSDVVSAAVGADSRIGGKYLKGALGFGGPCFPRDNRALEAFARRVGVDAPLPRATDAINDRQVERVVNRITAELPRSSQVAVLGLAYKPDTNVCEASQGIDIANQLHKLGYSVTVHDPQALEMASTLLAPDIAHSDDALGIIHTADGVVIATAWREYMELDPSLFANKVVIDPWSVLKN